MPVIDGTTGDESYTGAVLKVEWRSIYTYDPISTHYATVWDTDAGEVRDIVIGGDYAGVSNRATVDADIAVRLTAASSVLQRYIDAVRHEDIVAWREAVIEEHRVTTKGERVIVARGRKVPRGTTGIVFWSGPDAFSPSWQHRGDRVGIIADDGTRLYTAAANLDAIDRDPPALSEYTASDEAVRDIAWGRAIAKFAP